MIRPLAALALTALLLGSAHAQSPEPAAEPEIVVDPAATFNTSPKQANMLTGFYATQAVIEICEVTIEPSIAEGMAADRARLENALGLDPASAATAYADVKADVEKTSPDCAEGSPDRLGVDAVTAIYAAQSAPAGTVTPAAEPAPTPPAEPAEPTEPAPPAQ